MFRCVSNRGSGDSLYRYDRPLGFFVSGFFISCFFDSSIL